MVTDAMIEAGAAELWHTLALSEEVIEDLRADGNLDAAARNAYAAMYAARPTADLGDDGELDAALLRARTNIQMGGNTLRIDSTDLQLFVRVLSRSGADNTRVKDQSHGG